nr:uncharacterized protein LOC105866875 isoform X2 [Microcebus murinus]
MDNRKLLTTVNRSGKILRLPPGSNIPWTLESVGAGFESHVYIYYICNPLLLCRFTMLFLWESHPHVCACSPSSPPTLGAESQEVAANPPFFFSLREVLFSEKKRYHCFDSLDGVAPFFNFLTTSSLKRLSLPAVFCRLPLSASCSRTASEGEIGLMLAKLAAAGPDFIFTHYKSQERESIFSPMFQGNALRFTPFGPLWVTCQPWNQSLRPEGWNTLIGFSQVTCPMPTARLSAVRRLVSCSAGIGIRCVGLEGVLRIVKE